MRLSNVQPKKNFSYIFVQFPGMKMNAPMLLNEKGKAVKEDVALCVQLNSKEKVNQIYYVRTQSIVPFDYTDEGNGAKASYRVIKQQEITQDSRGNEPADFVTVITDGVVIVQKKSKKGYDFVLVFNNREMGIIASIEEAVLQKEKETMQLHENEKKSAGVNSVYKKNMIVFGRSAKKKSDSGGNAFQDIFSIKPIRMFLEGVKRKYTVFSPAALDFIGPGDRNQTIFIERGCR